MEFEINCVKLRHYAEKFHPDTTIECLEDSELASIVPELMQVGVLRLNTIEKHPGFKTFQKMKLRDLCNKYCNNRK